MILITLLLVASITTVITLFIPGWVNDWYDFWIPICGFLTGFLGTALIICFIIIIASCFVSLNKPITKPKKFYTKLCKRAGEFLLQIGRVKVLIRGMEKIPSDQKFLLISNHQSNFDAIVTIWTMRAYDLSFIMKDSLIKLPIIGKCLYAAGFLGLNRSNDREGLKTIIHAIHMIEENQSSIQVCPEGTRSKKFEMLNFHHGSFKIALKAKCPIVVVGIQNTCCIHHRFPWRSTKVYFDVIDVLSYESIEHMTTQEISDLTHKMIQERIEEFPKEPCSLTKKDNTKE